MADDYVVVDGTKLGDFVWSGIHCSLEQVDEENSNEHVLHNDSCPSIIPSHGGVKLLFDNAYCGEDFETYSYIMVAASMDDMFDEAIAYLLGDQETERLKILQSFFIKNLRKVDEALKQNANSL